MSEIKKYIKSPLRYPGGKNKMVNTIKHYFPKDFDKYMEPFVGGGSIFAYIKQEYPDLKAYWINDKFFSLATLYECLKFDADKVIDKINSYKEQYKDNGNELFEFCKNNIYSYSPIIRASCFFILNRITFSGTILSGGYSKQAFENRFTDSSIDRLKKFSELFKEKVITSNEDYSILVDNADENTFIYLDPPYHTAEKSALYGEKGNLHKYFNHEELVEKLKICRGKWLITYDDCEYIRNLYSFANIYPVEYTYSMKNVGKNKQKGNKEIIITNYAII